MKDMYTAEDIDKAQVAIKAFEIDYGAKYPKAVAKIVDHPDMLLEFCRYPAEHWIHLRTTKPNRIHVRDMACKLIEAVQTRWRSVNAPHLVALVCAGATFHKGKLLERPVDLTSKTSPTWEPNDDER